MIKLNKVYHGDCLKVMKDIEDNSINLVLTDPPYQYLTHKLDSKINLPVLAGEYFRLLKNNSFLIIFGIQPYIYKFHKEFEKYFDFKQEIIFDKIRPSHFTSKVLRSHENIFIYKKGNAKFKDFRMPYHKKMVFNSEGLERNLQGINSFLKDKEKVKNLLEYLEMGDKELLFNPSSESRQNKREQLTNKLTKKYKRDVETAFKFIEGIRIPSILSFPNDNYKKDNDIKHPTLKPLKLIQILMKLCSDEGDIVLDSFLGSGTTAVACEELKRNWIGIEKDKEYFELAKQRIKNYKLQLRLF